MTPINSLANSTVLTYQVNSTEDKGFKMAVKFVCDRSKGESDDIKFENDGTTEGYLKLVVISKKSCPMFSLTYLYSQYPSIFAIIFLGAGLFIAFVGIRMYKIVLFLLATFLVTFILVTVIYQMIMSKFVEQWAFWTCLGVSAAVGLTAGVLVVIYNKYCFVIAGACLGGIGGFFLYNMILCYHFESVLEYRFPN